MQNIRFVFLLVALFFAGTTEGSAQYYPLNNFWLSPQLTAPTAMAGNNYHQVAAHYAKQAFGENLGYRSLLLSGQFPVYVKRNTQIGTLGINLMRDESGSSYLFSTSGVMLSYLYDVSLSSRHHLVGGVQGGYFGRRVDWNRVTTEDQYVDGSHDPLLPHGEVFDNEESTALTTNVGVAYYLADRAGEEIFHVGVGIQNLNKGRFVYLETDKNQAEPVKWVVYSTLRLISNPSFEVASHVYWRQENQLYDLVGGLLLKKGLNPRERVSKDHLGVGVYYSPDQTGTFALQLLRANWLMAIGYSMPFGNNVPRNLQSTAEVTLGWRLERPNSSRAYNSRAYKRKGAGGQVKKKLPWKGNKKFSHQKVKKKGAWKSKKSLPWKKNEP